MHLMRTKHNTDDTEGELPATLVGTIEEDGIVIGKIILCWQINMYEGYYNHYGNTQNNIQNFLSAKWFMLEIVLCNK